MSSRFDCNDWQPENENNRISMSCYCNVARSTMSICRFALGPSKSHSYENYSNINQLQLSNTIRKYTQLGEGELIPVEFIDREKMQTTLYYKTTYFTCSMFMYPSAPIQSGWCVIGEPINYSQALCEITNLSWPPRKVNLCSKAETTKQKKQKKTAAETRF